MAPSSLALNSHDMKPEDRSFHPSGDIHSRLQQAFSHFNELLFENALPQCLITVQSGFSSPAYLVPNSLEAGQGNAVPMIVLNSFLLHTDSDEFVLATLAHEMCHLWQRKFGTPGRGRYHNAEWAEKMRSIGLTPTHNGQFGGRSTGDQMQHLIQASGKFERAYEQLCKRGFAIGWRKYSPPPSHGHGNDKGRPLPGLRMKYTCGCFTNLWGKPGVRAICVACNTHFTPNLA